VLKFINYIKAFIVSPNPPLWRYSLYSFFIAIIPSIILLFLINWIFDIPNNSIVPTGFDGAGNSYLTIFRLIIATPLLETLILAGVLVFLSKGFSNIFYPALISAILWGLLHSLKAFPAFFGTAWSFFIFSYAFLVWRSVSFKKAFIASAVPHALINLTVVLVLAFFG